MTTCFAFNKSGLRCMAESGHEGLHTHAILWSDDECWVPGVSVTVVGGGGGAGGVAPAPEAEHLVDGYVPPEKRMCVICDHKMHSGVCNVEMGGFGCDCANGVEA